MAGRAGQYGRRGQQRPDGIPVPTCFRLCIIAERCLRARVIPVGGDIVGRGANRSITTVDPTAHAEIDALEATIAQLSTEITELNPVIASADAAVTEAKSIREAEKAKHPVVSSDAKVAAEAVAIASNVLK